MTRYLERIIADEPVSRGQESVGEVNLSIKKIKTRYSPVMHYRKKELKKCTMPILSFGGEISTLPQILLQISKYITKKYGEINARGHHKTY